MIPTIADLRNLAHDTTLSNLTRSEVPMFGKQDGANKVFYLQNIPIVTASVYITIGTSIRSQSGFTVDLTNGIITFTTAPAAAPPSMLADYNWNWFTDAEHQKFIDDATRTLGFIAGSDVDEGLLPALYQYALADFWERRATQYAHRYSSSGGMAGHNVDQVTNHFMELAKFAREKAIELRDSFYMRQGRREAPSSAVMHYGIDPGSPIR